MKLNTFRSPEYHCVKMHREDRDVQGKQAESRACSRKIAQAGQQAEPDAVILALAIRGIGTCELRIPKAKYDGILLLEHIKRHGDTLH